MSDLRHIYVGMSKKTWCGHKVRRNRDGSLHREEAAPITEGEYIDGYELTVVCPDCAEACSSVRGQPN